MRVLHVNSGNLFGGVESLLLTLARHPGPMEPHFALAYDGAAAGRLRDAGAPVHRLGAVRARRPWSVVRARQALRRLLASENFDVAVCHSAWSQAVFGPAVRRAGVPLAFWLHDPPAGRLHWLERWAARTPPDVAVCNSRYTRGLLPRIFPNTPGETVYCPVAPGRPVEARYSVRARVGAEPGAVVVVQVGRWERHKGHLALVEALGLLRDVPGWECWQVGAPQRPHEADYLRELRALAERLGVADRVRFLGWQPDLASVLAAADLYCQPNVRPEPFGLTYVEALAAGLPVVATPLGGPCEIVDDSCGRLVPPDRPDELSAALRALIGDAALRARLGAAGPPRARELCDPDRQAGRLAEVLTGVALGRGPRHRRPTVSPEVPGGKPMPLSRRLARALVPRSVRNWVRSPARSLRWLGDEAAYLAGRRQRVEVRPGWVLDCHPSAFRLAYHAQQDDPEQTAEFDQFVAACRPGMVLYDLGAHFGLFSLAALHYGGPRATAVAVDASPSAVRMVRIQAALNGVGERLRVRQACMTSRPGTCRLVAAGVMGAGYFLPPGPDHGAGEGTAVPAMTLDELVESTGPTPTHLKIDVEGFEGEVLRGGRKTLTADPAPLLFLELHNAMTRDLLGADPAAVLDLLDAWGYRLSDTAGRPLTRDSVLSRPIVRVLGRRAAPAPVPAEEAIPVGEARGA